jgi:hypothetical protein
MLYFFIPFAIAITIMGVRELWLSVILPWQQKRKAPSMSPARAVAPPPSQNRNG